MNIKPGQSIKVSEFNGIVCTMERSGKGDAAEVWTETQDGAQTLKFSRGIRVF